MIQHNGRPIESRIWSIERRKFQWPWTTPTPSFNITPFFDAECLRNDTTYRHNVIEMLIGTCTPYGTVSFRMTLNELEWLSKIFNNMKRRAVSLRQLSFLLLLLLLLLNRRSRQRERLHATGLSICLFVCLSVCLLPKYKNAIFSKTKQFRAMVSIDDLRKSYMGFLKNPLLDP